MNKVALVTGAARGIGRGIALAFAQAGYDVSIHYGHSQEAAVQLQGEIQQLGVRGHIVQGDMEDPETPVRIVSETVHVLGRLDVLVSNAGFFAKDSLASCDVELMDRLYRTNFRGMALCVHAAAAYFRENGILGCILLNTSVRAYCAHVDDCTYGALKEGLNRMISSFALALGPDGIRVNGFAPGVINVTCPEREREAQDSFYGNTHRFIPLRRNGRAADVADPVLFLASEQARYITGTVLQIDGGLSCVGAPEDLLGVRQVFDVTDWQNE